MREKGIWLLASMILILSLVACGNEEKSSESPKDSESKQNTESSTTNDNDAESKT